MKRMSDETKEGIITVAICVVGLAALILVGTATHWI
jgi:hypothetical protein